MWTELAQFVKANSTETLLITIIGTVFVWMYKLFNGMIERERQELQASLQIRQKLLFKIELSIASVLHVNDEPSKQLLFALFGEFSPYLNKMHRQIIRDYYKTQNPMILTSLQTLIITDLEKLHKQSEKEAEEKEDSAWLVYLQRLTAPFWPILLLLFMILITMFCINLFQKCLSIWDYIVIVFFIFSSLLSVLCFCVLIQTFYRREVGKQGAKRWGAMIFFILSPTIPFVFKQLELFSVILVLQLVAMWFLKVGKRPPRVIQP
ncbi:hypothetical protein [Gorillibacterium timonense]|uniref:hypothetical protein n=1 Tax=Gorillibacterium timonense TaxID=1689269 RepID=UPI00071CDA82|nr:hypothetical protein [Gorillibacterium timonense]